MKTIDSIEKQIIELAAAAAVLSIAFWELAQISARMEHGFVGVFATTEIISQCCRQLVGLAVQTNGRRQVGRLQHNGAQRYDLLFDGTEHLRFH